MSKCAKWIQTMLFLAFIGLFFLLKKLFPRLAGVLVGGKI